MLTKIERRRTALGLSVRQLSRELGVSHTLLSLVLNGHRKPSKGFRESMRTWLDTPVVIGAPTAPSTIYQAFISEKTSQVAPLTVKFYKAKLAPFAVWCEHQGLVNVDAITRTDVSMFLGFIRKGRRKALSNGALKLHHQTLKTFFSYVGETCDVSESWKNPVDGIKVKGSQAQTLEYSDTEIKRMFEIVDSNPDELLRLRNRAILMVLLNSAMRASELLAVNVAHIGADGRVKVTGKGSKQEARAFP